MLIQALLLTTCVASQAKIEAAHSQNQVYNQVLDQGLEVGGQTVKLPAPRLVDGQIVEAQRAALREVAGSDRAVDDMFRDSVTAPFIIKVRDVKASGATIRTADVWFAVYGDLKQVDPAREAARTDQKEVETANMWFQTRILKADEIRAAGIKPAESAPGLSVWFAHVHAKLLDRIEFEATNAVMASQAPDSIVIATRTDASFDKTGSLANVWNPITTTGGTRAEGSAKQPYAGGMSYAKTSQCAIKPGALLVEMHFAFVEPDGWFQGQPILRSKFGVVTQDQIRTLRRELAKKRAK
jgi:hypothetical protein